MRLIDFAVYFFSFAGETAIVCLWANQGVLSCAEGEATMNRNIKGNPGYKNMVL
jgi:hypothetical protein